jgi:hypothetical protein
VGPIVTAGIIRRNDSEILWGSGNCCGTWIWLPLPFHPPKHKEDTGVEAIEPAPGTLPIGRDIPRRIGRGKRQLRELFSYKAQRAGIALFLRSQAEFSCLRWGYEAHADHNAAGNLATRGAVTRPDLCAPVRGQLAFA